MAFSNFHLVMILNYLVRQMAGLIGKCYRLAIANSKRKKITLKQNFTFHFLTCCTKGELITLTFNLLYEG